MESKRKILKRNMSIKYCGETRFDFLDKEERPMIYKAMQEYAEAYHKDKLKKLLVNLGIETEEIIMSPIRFNGVHIEKIKRIFKDSGIVINNTF